MRARLVHRSLALAFLLWNFGAAAHAIDPAKWQHQLTGDAQHLVDHYRSLLGPWYQKARAKPRARELALGVVAMPIGEHATHVDCLRRYMRTIRHNADAAERDGYIGLSTGKFSLKKPGDHPARDDTGVLEAVSALGAAYLDVASFAATPPRKVTWVTGRHQFGRRPPPIRLGWHHHTYDLRVDEQGRLADEAQLGGHPLAAIAIDEKPTLFDAMGLLRYSSIDWSKVFERHLTNREEDSPVFKFDDGLVFNLEDYPLSDEDAELLAIEPVSVAHPAVSEPYMVFFSAANLHREPLFPGTYFVRRSNLIFDHWNE